MFSHLVQALNEIFNVGEKYQGWRATLKSFFFFLLTSSVLLFSLLAGSTFLILASKLERIPLLNSYVILLIGNVAVETLFLALSYKFLSQRKLAFRSVIVGGLTATILWEILKHIFGVYIVRIELYSMIYGSIGSLILLMLWLYYSILIYFLGAEIAMELELNP